MIYFLFFYFFRFLYCIFFYFFCIFLGFGIISMDLSRWNRVNRKVFYLNVCLFGYRTFREGRYGRLLWLSRIICIKEKIKYRYYINRFYGNIGRRLMSRRFLMVESVVLRRRRLMMRRRKFVMLIKGWVRCTRWGGGVNIGMYVGGGFFLKEYFLGVYFFVIIIR